VKTLKLAFLIAFMGTPLFAADPAPEKLAGEDDKAVPTAVPTAAADVRVMTGVTRAAQAAPSFNLPDFVVTGSGERKAFARRESLGGSLDTSGGFKTSPAERGAGKEQIEAKAERATLAGVTYAVRSRDGWLRGAYGLANTGSLDGYWGGVVREGWVLALQGHGGMSDGAPASLASRSAGAGAALSWEDGPAGLWDLNADYDVRNRSRGADALDRQATGLDLAWHMKTDLGAWQAGYSLSQRQARADLALDLRLRESAHDFNAGWDSLPLGRQGSTRLELRLGATLLDQENPLAQLQRSVLWNGSLMSLFEPLPSAQLGIGLSAQVLSGDRGDLMMGPRVDWQQRLTPQLAWHARFGTGLELSRFDHSNWGREYRLPNAALPPSHLTADVETGAAYAWSASLSLEARLFAKQNESHFLPQDTGRGTWVDSPVRDMTLLGGELKQRWESGSWWQELSLLGQQAQLKNFAGARATFIPAWTARLAAGGRYEGWHGQASLDGMGERETGLLLGATLPAMASVSAELAYDFNESWTAFVEGKQLTGGTWTQAPGFEEAGGRGGRRRGFVG
jgi:hypothetical protein